MASYIWLLTLFLMGCGGPAIGKKYHDKFDNYYEYLHHNYNFDKKYNKYERYEPIPFQPKRHTFIEDFGPSPPPPDQVAKMARFIVHNTEWAAMATHSSQPAIKGYPFANTVSISDGPMTNSSGVPYMYISPLEMSTQDIEVDPRCTLVLTLAELDFCTKNKLDPQDPQCAKISLTGKIMKVKTYTPEVEFAQEALFSRHPAMPVWPKSHGFYFAKLKIEQIVLLDYYGGPKVIPLQEYFNPSGDY